MFAEQITIKDRLVAKKLDYFNDLEFYRGVVFLIAKDAIECRMNGNPDSLFQANGGGLEPCGLSQPLPARL